jgi:hypothetical protein
MRKKHRSVLARNGPGGVAGRDLHQWHRGLLAALTTMVRLAGGAALATLVLLVDVTLRVTAAGSLVQAGA